MNAVVTDVEVTTITQTILTATNEAGTGRISYLRALLGATQEALNKKKGQDAPVQLAALNTVHERFYAIVLEAAQPFVPRTQKDRSIELHRRVNFARTTLSSLRGHVRAGADLCALNAPKVTKSMLAVRSGPRRPATAARLKSRAENQSKGLVATLIGLADTDKTAAVEEIQLVLGQLTTQLLSMGLVSTKDAGQAFEEHRPLRVGKTLFMPTATQVIRQTARPS